MDPHDLQIRLSRIKVLFVDSDGVLTDGGITYGNYGDDIRTFDVKDGMGMALMRQCGIPVVIISARKCRIVNRRAKELKVYRIFQGLSDKRSAVQQVLKQLKLASEEACFIGDDLVDLSVLREVGLFVAVQDAVQEVRSAAQYVTTHRGGRGAIREVCDLILKAQGKWPEVMSGFTDLPH